jgi:histidinol-phosphate aminotransferase
MEAIMNNDITVRPELENSALTRPDWTQGAPRNSKLLWLDKNENMDPEYNVFVGQIVREVDPVSLYTYPETVALYHKLAAWAGVSPRNLILTPGSDGAIRYVFDAFIRPGDTVVHSAPTFAMYFVYCKIYGARGVTLDYVPSHNGPVLTVDTIVEAIQKHRPRLFCLPNPDSPTGSIITPDGLKRIIEAAAATGCVVLVDEAYHPFLTDSVITWVNDYKNLVVVRTFSKAWGMAGARVGYAAACADLTSKFHKSRPMYEIGTYSAALVERLLDYPDQMLASVRRLEAGKDFFLDEMHKLGLTTIRAHGNFFHVAFGSRAAAVHAMLKDVVLYRQDFAEPCLKGYSRFSATTAECFKTVIDKITQVIKS